MNIFLVVLPAASANGEENFIVARPAGTAAGSIRDGQSRKVRSVRRLKLNPPVPVYNLSVRNSANYLVSTQGILVHNCIFSSLKHKATRITKEGDELTLTYQRIDGCLMRQTTPEFEVVGGPIAGYDVEVVGVRRELVPEKTRDITDLIKVRGEELSALCRTHGITYFDSDGFQRFLDELKKYLPPNP